MPQEQKLWQIIDEYEEKEGLVFFIKCLECDQRFRSDALTGYGTHLLFVHGKSVSLQSLEFLIETLKKEKIRNTELENLKKTTNNELTGFAKFWNNIEKNNKQKIIKQKHFLIDPISKNFIRFMAFVESRRKDIEGGKKRYYLNTAFRTFWNSVELPIRKARTYKRKVEKIKARNSWKYQNDPEYRKKRNEQSKKYHQLHPEVHTKAWKKYAEKRRIKREQNIYEDIIIP